MGVGTAPWRHSSSDLSARPGFLLGQGLSPCARDRWLSAAAGLLSNWGRKKCFPGVLGKGPSWDCRGLAVACVVLELSPSDESSDGSVPGRAWPECGESARVQGKEAREELVPGWHRRRSLAKRAPCQCPGPPLQQTGSLVSPVYFACCRLSSRCDRSSRGRGSRPQFWERGVCVTTEACGVNT